MNLIHRRRRTKLVMLLKGCYEGTKYRDRVVETWEPRG
jgi:hypothetical protein